LTWCERKRAYDYITWEAAQVEARDAVVEHDKTSPLETESNAADMCGAAGTFSDRFKDANEDPYADVDMFLSGMFLSDSDSESESSELFSTQ
jgi:hypothetical protein